jgi:hypothetical protein
MGKFTYFLQKKPYHCTLFPRDFSLPEKNPQLPVEACIHLGGGREGEIGMSHKIRSKAA